MIQSGPDLNEFSCISCKNLALDPHNCTSCGQLTCGQCIPKVKDDACLQCKQKKGFAPSAFAKRILNTLTILCQNGCGENVAVNVLEKHG
jgi:hypothetical protein